MAFPEATRGVDERALAARARRSYELGRLAAGARGAWPVLLLLPIALVTHAAARAPVTWLVGATLFAVAVGLGWRGGALARGAAAGFLAGLPPLLLPILVLARTQACTQCELMGMGTAGERWPECLIACSLGGLAAGVYVGLRAARQARGSIRFAVAAALVAGLTGTLGCTLVGGAGALGIFAGLALGATPALLVARGAATRG